MGDLTPSTLLKSTAIRLRSSFLLGSLIATHESADASSESARLSYLDYLNRLRKLEMQELLAFLPAGARILEFGAGTGEQARFLSEHGYDVIAVDLPESVYAPDRVFPVQDYDGRHIPLDDQSVDIIFSSNVLEHVEDLATIFGEFRRILRPGGRGLHVMPTPAWRFWSLVTGLADAAATFALLPFRIAAPPSNFTRRQTLRRDLRRIGRGVIPRGHGTSSEAFSELWTFSPQAWRHEFRRHGFDIVEDMPMRLFYSGTVLFGPKLSFEKRRRLSSIFGSSIHIYLTQRAGRS